MAKQINIIVVPHTHWDREWYQTFQQFRIRLVRTIDKLLDILDQDDKFSCFTLDGQTIVLDDYLAVRPEQEEHLKRYTRTGRILIGPWYLQPDEFLVSGEALLRNLQFGLQRAAEFGQPMRVGYVPDCFGHIAQLPQILQGFGINSAIFWRGVSAEAKKSEFYWLAPDGSKVLVVHLSDPSGYSNARHLPLHPEELVTLIELLTANILPKATSDTLLFMNGTDHQEPQENLPTVIETANTLLAHLDPRHEQFLSGHNQNGESEQHYDSIHLHIGTLPQYIARIRQNNQQLQVLTGEMRSSQYAHLLPSVLSTRMWIKQQNAATEHLLEKWLEPLTAWAWKLGDSYPQGLVQMAWRYLLQNHPHDSICGCSIDQVHRENSARFAQSQQIAESVTLQAMQHIVAATDTRAPLAVSHPNNEPISIVVFNPAPGPRTAEVQVVLQLPGSLYNAVIVDELGTHMPYRIVNRWRQELGSLPLAREMLASAVTLAGVTTPEQLIHMAYSIMTAMLDLGDDAQVLSRISIEDCSESLRHHLQHMPQPGVVSIEVMIAPKGRIVVNEQELLAAGQRILELLEREDIHTLEVSLIDQARETIDFVAADLPAYGLKTFWLYPQGIPLPRSSSITNSTQLLVGQSHSIENEFYHVEVNAHNGTLTVIDKQTDVVFTGLNRFIDGGDVGDLYTYCPPEHDTLVSEPAQPPKIELMNAGPVRATLRITGQWAFPGSCTVNRTERSVCTTSCSIVSEVSLLPAVRRIDVHTIVENAIKDHRLRVLFPVPYATEYASAEGTFEVRTRPIAQPLPAGVAEWVEAPVNLFPQKRFVDVSNGKIGLGILNRGLPEYEVVRNGPGITEEQVGVALTLLRCVEWLSRGDLATRRGHSGPMKHTPEAQCLGHHEFDYALMPHRGTWQDEEALVLREAQAFNVPVAAHAVVSDLHEGQLPSRTTLVEVEPRELVISAIKRSNNGQGVIVRLYNPCDHQVEAKIYLPLDFTQVYVANLLEEPLKTLQSEQQAVRVDIRSGGILTLVFA
jgi:alpha-mannosidase